MNYHPSHLIDGNFWTESKEFIQGHQAQAVFILKTLSCVFVVPRRAAGLPNNPEHAVISLETKHKTSLLIVLSVFSR